MLLPIPSTDHIARLCKGSTCANGRPTADSFAYREHEPSLSAYWLEFFAGPATLSEKLDRLRQFRRDVEISINGALKVTGAWRLAVLSIDALRCAEVDFDGTRVTFECVHDPRAENDSHALIETTPARNDWPQDPDENAAFRMAIQRWLAEQVVHVEGALSL